jgi:beta-glucosidase
MYAETCFKEFGGRVKNWITFNEPHTVAVQGYDSGLHAPGRCSVLLHLYCKQGSSGTEPYIVAHNIILVHATVSDIYRNKYKVRIICIFLCSHSLSLSLSPQMNYASL